MFSKSLLQSQHFSEDSTHSSVTFQVEFLFVVLLEKHTESFQQLIMSRSVNISWGGVDTGFVKQKFEEIVRLTKSLIF